jgi:hypothetical protein
LIPTLRPIAISILLVSSAAAISQTIPSAGNPYTATKKVTFIQKLADGTTISRVSTTIEARDSQGRTVQQTTMTGNRAKHRQHHSYGSSRPHNNRVVQSGETGHENAYAGASTITTTARTGKSG